MTGRILDSPLPMSTPQPRRSAGLSDSRFKPGPRRADPDQFSEDQQICVELEALAVELTIGGHHGWADRTRAIARRLA